MHHWQKSTGHYCRQLPICPVLDVSGNRKPYETFLSQMLFPEEYTEIITDNASLYDELSPLFAKSFPEKPFRFYRDNMLSLSKLYSLETK